MPYLISYKFFDDPIVIDCEVTPIPKASDPPLLVIVNSGLTTGVGMTYIDDTGVLIGVYVGELGQEQLVCVVGAGHAEVGWGVIPMESRVSLRAIADKAITGGTFHGALVTLG